jgi:2-dehydro-3-deoxygluconokinase
MTDLVTFGEAMVRLTPPGFQRLEQARSLDVHVGGGELNVAVGASRLGLSTRWVSRLTDNPLGRMIANHAREHGVDLSHVAWTAEDRTGIYFAELGAAPRASTVLYDRSASAMSRIAPGMIDWSNVFEGGAGGAGARWFHMSGITPALGESAAATTVESLAAAKKLGISVSYDLNYRSKLWSADKARAVQEPMMEHVDVLITTEEDTRVVFGIGSRGSGDAFTKVESDVYGEVARRLQERFGVRAVAITLRENPLVWTNTWSALIFADGELHCAPRYEVEIVDRIGAGDAFSAGLIHAFMRDNDWGSAVRFGTALSALKHTVPGDFSQATLAEVEQVLAGDSLRVKR